MQSVWPLFSEEANLVGVSNTKRIHVGTYITIKGVRYEVLETGDGNLYLGRVPSAVEVSGNEVVPTPETVV